MAEPAKWTSCADFLFGTPLYVEVALSNDELGGGGARSRILRLLFLSDFRVDGHCPDCGRDTTFIRAGSTVSKDDIAQYDLFEQVFNPSANLTVTCSRSENHAIDFWISFNNKIIQKLGHFPSFADIANDEGKKYRKLLSKEDSAELHKAIGLAAYGVGIGAFVYLRRIFEHLVFKRFNEFKDVEGWNHADFLRLRMNEKIDWLKDHLPAFMVKNSKLYSILSLGVHELSEQQCLAAFGFLKQSIFFILDEDIKKKEELAAKAAVEKAIAEYQ
jgi:hypothetical protein